MQRSGSTVIDNPATPWVALIEDDNDQADLVKMAIAKAGLRVRVHCIGDGALGLASLRRWITGEQWEIPRPALAMVDIKLPVMNGVEILQALRDEALDAPFPIIMLTSSKLPDDLVRSFGAGAVSYFVKPIGFHQLVELMDTIGRRWLESTPSGR